MQFTLESPFVPGQLWHPCLLFVQIHSKEPTGFHSSPFPRGTSGTALPTLDTDLQISNLWLAHVNSPAAEAGWGSLVGLVPVVATNSAHNRDDSESSQGWGWKIQTNFGTQQNMPLSTSAMKKAAYLQRQQAFVFPRFNPQEDLVGSWCVSQGPLRHLRLCLPPKAAVTLVLRAAEPL